MKAEEYKERKETLSGWPVKIVSYRAGNTYHVTVHNVEPGAWIAKAEAPTLAEAEAKATAQAGERLAKVKRHS